MRLESAAEQDSSKQEKAQECAQRLAVMTNNGDGEKGDKIKITLKMMQLESLLKAEKVL